MPPWNGRRLRPGATLRPRARTPLVTARVASRPRRLPLVLGLAIFSIVFAACAASEEARGWAPPVSVGDAVLIQDERGTLKLLDIQGSTASVRWQFPTGDDEVALEAVYAAPIHHDGVLYVASYSGLVVALNAETGRPIDRWPGPLNLGDRILATPVLHEGQLTVITEDGHVRRVDTATGTLSPVLDELGERIWGSPAAAGGTLFVGSLAREIIALDATSGERRWTANLPGAVAGALVAEGDTVFVGTFDRKVRALDATSEGAERWSFEGGSWFWSRPLVEPGTVYVASVAGQVAALDPATGASQWETQLDRGEVRAAPVIIEGTLVIATREGYLVGLDAQNGAQRWEHSLSEEKLLADPLVLDSRILYLTDKGTLVRVNPADGQVEQLYRRN